MIARMWKGQVPLDRSDEYLQRMRTVAIPDYKSTAGNMEAYCLPRTLDDRADFVMPTFWEFLEAIKAFNDDDNNVANHYEMDDRPSLNPTA